MPRDIIQARTSSAIGLCLAAGAVSAIGAGAGGRSDLAIGLGGGSVIFAASVACAAWTAAALTGRPSRWLWLAAVLRYALLAAALAVLVFVFRASPWGIFGGIALASLGTLIAFAWPRGAS